MMSLLEVEKSVKEIWEIFKETDRRLDKRFEETDRRLDKRFEETDNEIKRLSQLFTGQWGKLIESLAESGILEQLKSRGISVTRLFRRSVSRQNGREMELDFLLTNDTEVVLGEVKTTMKNDYVNNFLNKLGEFLYFYPHYKGFKIYGTMIGLSMEEESAKYAYRKGLFVFKVGGEGMLQLLNDAKFMPKDFSNV
ncbi:hypothetical protein H8E88_01070 [candidate division KSB1 bacterium]|nr:hypothetical protein [candidate division KSB1 bacterium]